ncbi:hypothetical protein [Streptomyces sp. NPDC051211]|uniref:hypothetical protein n=1 Tax=Streptomyces sp. NPDC051211 TaxID=3154643 RepID=UPI00344C9DDB
MRRGALTALTALTGCLAAAAVLTGCGGPARDGYVAVGAAGAGPERAWGETVPPKGPVEFQALSPAPSGPSGPSDTSGTSSTSADPANPSPRPGSATPGTPPGTGTGSEGPGAGGTGGTGGSGGSDTDTGTTAPATPGDPGTPGTPGATAPPATPGRPGTPSPPATPAPPTTSPTKPGTTAPATPAKLLLGTPVRTATADRWCEKVTVRFTNTGTTAARSGTVTFATHIIGALGIDWATITSSQPLPAPIAGGTSQTRTYTVCVDAWRVPLGMHIETQQVTATWR